MKVAGCQSNKTRLPTQEGSQKNKLRPERVMERYDTVKRAQRKDEFHSYMAIVNSTCVDQQKKMRPNTTCLTMTNRLWLLVERYPPLSDSALLWYCSQHHLSVI